MVVKNPAAGIRSAKQIKPKVRTTEKSRVSAVLMCEIWPFKMALDFMSGF
jgi:hypothetical protein